MAKAEASDESPTAYDCVAECQLAALSDASEQTAPSQVLPYFADARGVQARVISFELPKVRVAVGSIKVGMQTFHGLLAGDLVHADDLLPLGEAPKTRVVIPTEPALMSAEDATEELPMYDFAPVELPFCRSLAEYALHWAHA